MKDETVWIIVVAVIVYYLWYGKKRAGSSATASGSAWSGTTVNTSGPSAGRNRWGKGLSSTPTQGTGRGFGYAPIAGVGQLNGTSPGRSSGPGSPTALGSQRGVRSSGSGGWAAGFVAPSWPTKQVTSTGSRQVGTGVVQVPSYTAVPLTPVGPGGGGSLVFGGQ